MLKNEDFLRQKVPAAFATAPEDGRVSDRYSFLPTYEVLHILEDEGWAAWDAKQVNSRTWSKEHAKHLIRLRHADLNPEDFGPGDTFPEMILSNSHNGLGEYQLRFGMFRLVCSNGLIISDTEFGVIKIRHIGFEPSQVIEASRRIINGAENISGKVETWKGIPVSKDDKLTFLRNAAELRFKDPSDDIVRQIGMPRRQEDFDPDLWTLFNVAQENLLNGGFRNEDTRRQVRKITNINKDISLNEGLWNLTNDTALSLAVN